MDKQELLQELKNTWCRLAPSGIEGVGVFAVRDIPEGTHPFTFGKEDWMDLTKDELKDIPVEVFGLIETYCTFNDGKYNVPTYGFKMWDMVDFLNHSKNSNVMSLRDGEDFITTKKINKGEELLIDYDTIDKLDGERYRK